MNDWRNVCISYSLFGRKDLAHNRGADVYAAGVEMVGLAWRRLAPEVDLALFVDFSSLPALSARLVERSVEEFEFQVFERGPSAGLSGACWRFEPIWMDYDFVFPRDLDSLPTLDEAANMQYFLGCSAALQLLRSRWHVKSALAGLCGIHSRRFRARFSSPQAFWQEGDFTKYGSEEKRLTQFAQDLSPGECVEGHNSHRFAGSRFPQRTEIMAHRPVSAGYPEAGFMGKILRKRQIRNVVAALRSEAGY